MDLPEREIWVEFIRRQLGFDAASMPAGWMRSLASSMAVYDGPLDDDADESDGSDDQWVGWPGTMIGSRAAVDGEPMAYPATEPFDYDPSDEHTHGRQ